MTHVSVITVQPSLNQQAVEAGRCCAMPPPAAGPLVQTTATTPAVIGAVDHAEWLSGLSPKSYRGGSKRKALTAFAADDEDFFSFLGAEPSVADAASAAKPAAKAQRATAKRTDGRRGLQL